MRKVVFIFFLVSLSLFAKERLYFLPQDSKEAKNDIIGLIDGAQTSIDVAMYNLSYKKIIKALEKAKKRGVDVKIYYEKSDQDIGSMNLYKDDRKLHTKIMMIDSSIVSFGSLNWTKKSFGENYEVMYMTDRKKIVKEFVKFFKGLD